jgi:cation diffusion facilitator CzcD-associated flavoprotein CzcO
MEPVVIVGAGPAGLATAAGLKRVGIGFRLIDRSGVVGGAFREMPRGMRLLSPRRYVDLPGFPYPGEEQYPRMPDYEHYLGRYAARFGLVPERREVVGIKRAKEGFELRCASAEPVQCRFVVVATGLFGHPVWPRIEGISRNAAGTDCATNRGESMVLHSHNWGDRVAGPGKRMLIVGSGISGVSLAEDFVKAGAEVMVSRRRSRTRLVPPRILGADILHWFRPVEFLPRGFFGKLCQRGVHPPAYDNGYRGFVRTGKIVEKPEVQRVRLGKVTFVDASTAEVDVIVVATGYRYETPFLPAEIRRAPGDHPIANGCESVNWPGLFFVGAPCARRIDSEFLRGIASDSRFVAGRIRQRLQR